jgi:hypothetical protein
MSPSPADGPQATPFDLTLAECERRMRDVRSGGDLNEIERGLALILDMDVGRELAPHQLALAIDASMALRRDPGYVRALADAREAQDARPEVDAIDARLDSGERVTTAEIDQALAAERRRLDAASGRVVAVAMRVPPARRRRARVRPLGTVSRPRARRTHAQTRSYSRAGDSGGDDPPDEPPLARLRAFLRSLTRRLGRS